MLVAKCTNITCRLLSTAKTTKHSYAFEFFMHNYWVHDMTIITTKASATTTVSIPFIWKFHVFASSFSWELGVSFNLWNFKIRIEKFKSHVAYINWVKTVMTVSTNSFTGKIYFCFWYLVSTDASNLESKTSHIK